MHQIYIDVCFIFIIIHSATLFQLVKKHNIFFLAHILRTIQNVPGMLFILAGGIGLGIGGFVGNEKNKSVGGFDSLINRNIIHSINI